MHHLHDLSATNTETVCMRTKPSPFANLTHGPDHHVLSQGGVMHTSPMDLGTLQTFMLQVTLITDRKP